MRARLIRSLLRVFAALPLPLAHAIGAGIGAGLMLVPNALRRISRINIPLCLPELTRAAQRTLLRRSLVEAGKTMCEAGALWQWPRARAYHLHFIPPPSAIQAAPIELAARVMNEGVEALVRRGPQQYQWGYKRFRTRPAGEKPLY